MLTLTQNEMVAVQSMVGLGIAEEQAMQTIMLARENQKTTTTSNNDLAKLDLSMFQAPVKKEYKSHLDVTFVGYVSDGIARYVFDLYTRHGLDHAKLDGMNYYAVKQEVERLNAMPFPPSPAQKETIFGLIEEIKALQPEFDVPVDVLNGLTGGQEGNVSQFIQFLYEKRNKLQLEAPLDEKQANELYEWFYCTDVPWEDVGVSLKKACPTELNPKGWSFVTEEEFKAQLTECLTKQEAYEFISKHRGTFNEWKRSRINNYQIAQIRRLEDRMSNLSRRGIVTFAEDMDGNIVQTYSKNTKEWAPVAYEPMDEFYLKQLSFEQAEAHIKQLESEMSMRFNSAINNSQNQQQFEDKVQRINKAKKNTTEIVGEHAALIDLVFWLESAVGQENEGLHEAVNELMANKKGNPLDVAKELDDFMMFAYDNKFITLTGLADMCSHSNIASQILEIRFPKEIDQIFNGKTDKVEQPEVKNTNAVDAFMASMK